MLEVILLCRFLILCVMLFSHLQGCLASVCGSRWAGIYFCFDFRFPSVVRMAVVREVCVQQMAFRVFVFQVMFIGVCSFWVLPCSWRIGLSRSIPKGIENIGN